MYVQAGGVQDNDGVDRNEYFGLSEVQCPDGQQGNISPKEESGEQLFCGRRSCA